jgi:tetratricopeptide (TPR) repeat protein
MKQSKRAWALAAGFWFVGVLAVPAADVPPDVPAPGATPAAVVMKAEPIRASAPEAVVQAAVPPSADPAPALGADRLLAAKTESPPAAAPGAAPASGPEKALSMTGLESTATAGVKVDNPGATPKAAEALANLKLARSFRKNLEWGQAIPLYEAYILENPNSPDLPLAVLELGRTYAQVGAYDAALSRFYSVLDLAVNQEGAGLTPGREVAFSARYEIARTQLALGRYAQAARLFLGMRRLPLIDGDRASIHLSGAQALNLAGDKPGAVEEYQALLQSFSDSPLAPEARFELAVIYAELGRRDDAVREVMALFERQKNSGSSDETWLYWQRRAGNQLANMFYSAGNLSEAAELYGKLLQLSGDARWRWPLLYQVGLVAEQMKDFAKAKISYTELAAAKAEGVSAEVAELPKLAQWRLEHLKWAERMDAELNSLKPGA